MRKLYLLVASCVAVVAFMGFSATGFANHIQEPACAGNNNAFEVLDFSIDTENNVVGAVSGLTGQGIACGTALDDLLENANPLGPHWLHGCGANGQTPLEGVESLNDRALIGVPPGVEINPSDNLNTGDGNQGDFGDYVGNASINIASCFLRSVSTQQAVLYAETNNGDDDCPDSAIACYYGVSPLGYNYSWVEIVGKGPRYQMTIGPFHALADESGLTRIHNFTLCGYAGSSSCGNGMDLSKWMQKNGDGIVSNSGHSLWTRGGIDGWIPRCNAGIEGNRGVYTVRVTNKANQTTAPVSSCVRWVF